MALKPTTSTEACPWLRLNWCHPLVHRTGPVKVGGNLPVEAGVHFQPNDRAIFGIVSLGSQTTTVSTAFPCHLDERNLLPGKPSLAVSSFSHTTLHFAKLHDDRPHKILELGSMLRTCSRVDPSNWVTWQHVLGRLG